MALARGSAARLAGLSALEARLGLRQLVIAFLALVIATPPAFAASNCPPRAARIRLAVVQKPLLVVNSQSIDAMHAESGQRRTAGRHHLGLTTSSVEWHSELNTLVSPPADGRGPVCAVPAEVVLTLVEAEHRISLAAEVPEASCLGRQVLAHERRHAAANRASLVIAARSARAAAGRWAAQARAQGVSADSAIARLQAGLRRSIEPSLAEMRAARAAAHARIDTAAEYRRLAKVCPADQARLRARLRASSSD